jgi:hypothetical protein
VITYKPKFLVNGYKLGAEFGGKWYVAVPSKHITNGPVSVIFDGKTIKVDKDVPPVTTRDFKDKFRNDTTYTLNYYLWPNQKQN